jgi:predicted secreted protein
VAKDSENITLRGIAGNPIDLPIAAGPATGHVWSMDLPSGVERIDDGPKRSVDPLTRLGGAIGGNLRVKAAKGEHLIVARLARPWEPDKPVRVVRIHLQVD